jgi:hypothetical protein
LLPAHCWLHPLLTQRYDRSRLVCGRTELIKGLEDQVERTRSKATSPCTAPPITTSAASSASTTRISTETAPAGERIEEEGEDEDDGEMVRETVASAVGADGRSALAEMLTAPHDGSPPPDGRSSTAPSMVQVTVGTSAEAATANGSAAASAPAASGGSFRRRRCSFTGSAVALQRRSEGHKLASDTAAEVQMRYRSRIKEDLDRGSIWACKTFCLFPLLVRLTTLDHIFRVAFPLAYLAFLLISLQEVDFGVEQNRLLNNAPGPCLT